HGPALVVLAAVDEAWDVREQRREGAVLLEDRRVRSLDGARRSADEEEEERGGGGDEEPALHRLRVDEPLGVEIEEGEEAVGERDPRGADQGVDERDALLGRPEPRCVGFGPRARTPLPRA